ERIVGEEHFLHALDLGGSVGDGAAIPARHQHIHRRRDGGGRRHRLGRGIAQIPVVVLGNNQRSHQITPTSLSLSTSSVTLLTLTPAVRLAGSLTFRTLRRGVTSTP